LTHFEKKTAASLFARRKAGPLQFVVTPQDLCDFELSDVPGFSWLMEILFDLNFAGASFKHKTFLYFKKYQILNFNRR
jgi:hypothetical protein